MSACASRRCARPPERLAPCSPRDGDYRYLWRVDKHGVRVAPAGESRGESRVASAAAERPGGAREHLHEESTGS